MEEFKERYEKHHARLFDDFIAQSGVQRYVRRYLTPIPNSIGGQTTPSPYDMAFELWFSDKALYESFIEGRFATKEFIEKVNKDEAELFEQDSISFNLTEDHFSK
jgi:hypothetical protein